MSAKIRIKVWCHEPTSNKLGLPEVITRCIQWQQARYIAHDTNDVMHTKHLIPRWRLNCIHALNSGSIHLDYQQFTYVLWIRFSLMQYACRTQVNHTHTHSYYQQFNINKFHVFYQFLLTCNLLACFLYSPPDGELLCLYLIFIPFPNCKLFPLSLIFFNTILSGRFHT